MRERRGEEGRAVWLSIYLHDCFIDLGLSYRSGDPFTPARVRERPVDEGLSVEMQLLFFAVIVNLPCATTCAFKAVALVGHGGEDGDETTLLHLHTYTEAIRLRILLVPDTRERRQGDEGRGDHREDGDCWCESSHLRDRGSLAVLSLLSLPLLLSQLHLLL